MGAVAARPFATADFPLATGSGCFALRARLADFSAVGAVAFARAGAAAPAVALVEVGGAAFGVCVFGVVGIVFSLAGAAAFARVLAVAEAGVACLAGAGVPPREARGFGVAASAFAGVEAFARGGAAG